MKNKLKGGIGKKIVLSMLIVGILPGIIGVFVTYIGATDLLKTNSTLQPLAFRLFSNTS